MHRAVKTGEQQALERLVELFDWFDGREPQPTREILELYEKSQGIEIRIANTLAQMDRATQMKAELDKFMTRDKQDSAVSFYLAYI